MLCNAIFEIGNSAANEFYMMKKRKSYEPRELEGYKCVGSTLKVQSKHFHVNCFKCAVCSSSLAQGGFFFKEGKYYCTTDYQKIFGTKCAACNKFVEGEVVTALGSTYHQKCFVCGRCR
ncbi:actin-binding LIM protein 1 [Caerostris extrusa]|uniref:Actin-binding LIM protein 1 n=1 Tax=Caerostris extrusa TaxID=172846 RepID=A0AAV4SQ74_CAEEX|nr:actin-binding LIM protein 1 [Caerostris extrusa]